MGWNTVFFGLNDLASEYRKSPNAFAEILSNAFGLASSHAEDYRGSVAHVARENGEPIPSDQALRSIACFHADNILFFQAGRNSMKCLNVLKYGKTKDGKKTVTLELPD